MLNTIQFIYTEYLAKVTSPKNVIHFTGDCFHFLANFVEKQTVYFQQFFNGNRSHINCFMQTTDMYVVEQYCLFLNANCYQLTETRELLYNDRLFVLGLTSLLTDTRAAAPGLQSALCDLCLTLLDQHDPRFGPSVYLSSSLVRSLKFGYWNTTEQIAYFTDQFSHKCTEMSQGKYNQLPYIEGFFQALLDGMNGFIEKAGEDGLTALLSDYNEIQASIRQAKDASKKEPGVKYVPAHHLTK